MALFRPRGEAVLGIGIQRGNRLAHREKFGRQVPRDRRLPDSSLPPRDNNDSHWNTIASNCGVGFTRLLQRAKARSTT